MLFQYKHIYISGLSLVSKNPVSYPSYKPSPDPMIQHPYHKNVLDLNNVKQIRGHQKVSQGSARGQPQEFPDRPVHQNISSIAGYPRRSKQCYYSVCRTAQQQVP